MNSKRGVKSWKGLSKIRGKKGFEFSFAWLFAIIVGAFILVGAIYAAVKVVNVGQYGEQTRAAKEITIIFNPLETGLADGEVLPIKLNVETRIYNKCSSVGNFGKQMFSVSQKSGFVKTWPQPGGEISVYNKYVFSDEIEQGTNFYFFSKPFEMPFKVSEVIFMISKNYCFVNPPGFVEDELNSLKIGSVNMGENCSSGDIRVCFGSGVGCNITIHGSCTGICDSESGEYDFGYTARDGKRLYYTGSLLYATVFSSPSLYDCNFKRLMKRISQVSQLYSNEASFLVTRGCGDVISTNLVRLAGYAESAGNTTSESSILNLRDAAEKLDMQNSAQGNCRIY